MESVDGLLRRYFVNPLERGYFTYDFIYPYSNENISDYLTPESCRGRSKGLAILGGGDHAFNLITNGVMNVDTFDINMLTEYYSLGLKRAMIMKYSYQKYMDIMRIIEFQKGIGSILEELDFAFDYYNDDIVKYLISDLRNDMDQKYRAFWDDLLYKCIKNNIMSIADLVFRKSCSTYDYFLSNNYLKNEEAYNLLKSNLGKANINFVHANVSDLVSYFSDSKYDIMLLSNTLSYVKGWGYSDFKSFLDSLGEISNDDALIFFHYIFEPVNIYISRGEYNRAPIFANSNVYYEAIDSLGLKVCEKNGTMVLVKEIGHRKR